MWNSEKQNKTKTKLKKHRQVFTAVQISVFPAFTLACPLLQDCTHTLLWDQGPMLWYEASWVAGVAWVQCQGQGGASASVLGTLLHIGQWTQTASPSSPDSGCCCRQLEQRTQFRVTKLICSSWHFNNFTPSWQNNNILWLKYWVLNTRLDKVDVSGVTNLCSVPQRAKQCRGPLLSRESLLLKQTKGTCVCKAYWSNYKTTKNWHLIEARNSNKGLVIDSFETHIKSKHMETRLACNIENVWIMVT